MRIITFILLILNTNNIWSAYYDTLPKGVRAAVYHRVQTAKVKSSFSGNNVESDYFFNFNLDAPSLESASDIFKGYLEPLKKESPEAYDALSLGEFEIDAYAEVEVNAFAFGYGITNIWTAYVVVPYFNAVVNMNIIRTQDNNNKQVQKILNTKPNNTTATALVNGITNSLPDVTGGVVQSVVVNYFGYQPLGRWEGKGIGDVELNNVIKLYDDGTKGMAMMLGVVAPTGRRDNPDIIQDFSFGDGQWDAYLEYGAGIKIPNSSFSFDSWARYTHQFASKQELRVAESEGLSLSSKTSTFKEKLGNIVSFSYITNYDFTDYLNTSAAYIFKHRFKTEYTSDNPEVDSRLEKGTEEESHTVSLALNFSTVNLYKKGKFVAPFVIGLSGQKIVRGQNTPNYERVDLEFRLFF